MEKYVITITKQFGSHGGEIGRTVAKLLNLPCYDRESLEAEAASRDETLATLCNWSENDISGYQKTAYPLGIGSILKQNRMYEVQSNLILEHASQESCVIIGRCADYILRERDDVIRCYIFAPYQARIENSTQLLGRAGTEPQRIIEEIDKARAEYYRTRTGCEVNNTRYRDIFLNSSLLGVTGTAELIVEAAKKKFHISAM